MDGRSTSDEHVRNEFGGSATNVVQSARIDNLTIHSAPVRRQALFLAPTRSSTVLVGRDELVEQLRNLPSGESLTLCGLPGVGKTALALHLAYDDRVRERFSDGVLWAGLGADSHVLRHLSVWGGAVGIRPEDVPDHSVSGWAEELHRVIARGKYLLVVDDVWDIEHALAFQLAGPGCAQVMTTRFPGVAAEFGGAVVKVAELSAAAGLDLLTRLAPDTVERNHAVAAKLVELVGGLPLALTLIGHRLRIDTVEGEDRVAETLDRLQATREWLELSKREAPSAAHPSLPPGMPVSLLATVDISYKRLPEAARTALCDLAAFPAKPESFAGAFARAVTTDPAGIAAAVRGGLLESLPGNRYSMHQVVHDFVWSKGRTGEAERRMAVFMVDMLTQEGVMTPDEVQQELGGILQALDHAHQHGLHETLLTGIDAAYGQLVRRGLYSVAEAHLRHALVAARATHNTEAEARTLVRLGSAVMELGELRVGEEYLTEGLRLAQQADLVGEIIDLLVRLGWSAGMRGNLEQARRHFADALVGATGVEATPALQGLGWVAGLQGKHAESLDHLRRALELARQAGDRGQVADVLQVAGWMRVQAAEYDAAQELFTECLAVAREVEQSSAEVDALHGLGWIAAQRGRYGEADALLTESLAIADDLGYHERLPIVIILGRVRAKTGHQDDARRLLAEALRLAREQGRPEKLCDALRETGRFEVTTGNLDMAEPLLRESLEIAERIVVRSCRINALEALAELELARGRTGPARESVLRAMRIGRTEPAVLARLRLWLAQVEEAEHGPAAAAELYLAAFTGADRTGQDEVAALGSFGMARAAAATGDQRARELADDSLSRLERISSPLAAGVRAWRDATL
ncbi:tetratricopeptide repeat protein [Actinocrispum wychmicini]|uniref:Tetratricopeptide repeat protein n=1 Tax=Actinocrispum wychmicini TaxID=1213861 RepID=A0A4R2IMT2_9PSEU|nr:tetratricopeptide repeat protein [Actinocrispum wychmicini]TCO45278.1 tetratricopeptide repeat protein [Actinocrispum wychmicini]